MTAQQIVFYIGIAAFVVAAALAAWSVYTFFALDVRGVMDDLSGRRRVVGQSGAGARRGRSGGAARRSNAVNAETAQAGQVQFSEVRAVDDEDNVETVVDAALRPVSVPSAAINSDKTTASAYKSAAQGMGGTYHQNDAASSAHELDAPTMVDGGDEVPTSVEGAMALPVFRVSRRIVLIHSDEVISAG